MNKILKLSILLITCLIIVFTTLLLTKDNCSELHKAEKYTEALPVCLASAKKGDAEAQYNLAEQYMFALGTTIDEPEAKKWYELSAAQGNGYASDRLGFIYFIGVGVPSDTKKAIEWYLKGCAYGNPYSCDSLNYLPLNIDL